jgi:hypothetical protein
MGEITDEYMKKMLSRTKHYCVVILSRGPNYDKVGKEKIIWEHGRRNFVLRNGGLMPIICPFADESNIAGLAIFNASIDQVKNTMDDDPAVKEGVLVYEVHDCISFPGDYLPY